jgi:hypothetical protein
MQLNLVHRDAVIATFDTDTMDPDEIRELMRLGRQRFFGVTRAVPDRLPDLPEGYSMLADVKQSQKREKGRGYRTGYTAQRLV